jgi:hypothetical protein
MKMEFYMTLLGDFIWDAFVRNDMLYRRGFESLNEDPGDQIQTSLKELINLGDPRQT